jgi:hypothetical protein
MERKICFVSLGSTCHPKVYIRNTNEITQESLPFDFNLSLDISNIFYILKKLNEDKKYNMNFTKIENKIDDGNSSLSIIEESGSKIVHFFNLNDLKNTDITYPCHINNIKPEKINEVTELFNKRYERFINLLCEINHKNIVFIREECQFVTNYDDKDVDELTKILFNLCNQDKNIYLIYTNHHIPNNLCYNNNKNTTIINGVTIFKYNIIPCPYDIDKKDNVINYPSMFQDVKNYIASL